VLEIPRDELPGIFRFLNNRTMNDFRLPLAAAAVGVAIRGTIRGGDGSTLIGPFLVNTMSKSVRSSCDGVGSIEAVARGIIGLGTMAGGISRSPSEFEACRKIGLTSTPMCLQARS